jgi:hypothetical protein
VISGRRYGEFYWLGPWKKAINCPPPPSDERSLWERCASPSRLLGRAPTASESSVPVGPKAWATAPVTNQDVEEWFDSSDTLLSLPENVRLQLTDVYFRNTNPQSFFERSTLDLSTVRALGFRLFSQHNPRLFWRCCADAELELIVLERENRFASYA